MDTGTIDCQVLGYGRRVGMVSLAIFNNSTHSARVACIQRRLYHIAANNNHVSTPTVDSFSTGLKSIPRSLFLNWKWGE
jgi:hypothetical protein